MLLNMLCFLFSNVRRHILRDFQPPFIKNHDLHQPKICFNFKSLEICFVLVFFTFVLTVIVISGKHFPKMQSSLSEGLGFPTSLFPSCSEIGVMW